MAERKFYGTFCKVRKERIKMKLASLFLFLMCLPFTTKPMLSEMLKDFDDSDIHFPAIFADKVSNTLNTN